MMNTLQPLMRQNHKWKKKPTCLQQALHFEYVLQMILFENTCISSLNAQTPNWWELVAPAIKHSFEVFDSRLVYT